MSERRDGVTPLQLSDLEQHARAYALTKAHDVRGEIVSMVLDRTKATIPDLTLMGQAEADLERRLAALVKNAIVEFTGMWTRELEHRANAMQKIALEAVAAVGSPRTVLDAKRMVRPGDEPLA